ncbi:MAG: MFS transporter [Ethanoligenens sp.]
MAAASGITVANLYYIQPLLAQIAHMFGISEVSMGFVAMLTQIGYALGMLFILPLADIREKKKLVLLMLVLAAVSLLVMALAWNVPILAAASLAIGFTSIVPQLMVPLAAQLANPQIRGRTIGSVMSGLLIGILVSRTFSGLIGQMWGWRTVYLIACALMVILALFLMRFLPVCQPVSTLPYGEAFRSMGALIKKYKALRQAAIIGAMMFASFSAFWTSLVFLLATPHYHMGADVAGLFGLVGITGALAAPAIGRISDHRSPKFTVGTGVGIVILSYVFFSLAGYQLWGLIAGVILLDLGVQSCLVSNQARIYALNAQARNRLNAVFMVTYFLGGSLGSLGGAYFYAHYGWIGVCLFGFFTQLIAVIVHAISIRTIDPQIAE